MYSEFEFKRRAVIMAMPVTVVVKHIEKQNLIKLEKEIKKVFIYLKKVDADFSPYKEKSEVSKYNKGEKYSSELTDILNQARELKNETNGYFDIMRPDGKIDPSGLVKGWAIFQAANILKKAGYKKFYLDVAGDAEIVGGPWKWGIRNPFDTKEIVKVLTLSDCGIATSGTYERGQHIYDPVNNKGEITDIVSLTIVGPNVFEADKFATPAFAMGYEGINFIENQNNLEGYMIDKDGIATMTSGFEKYVDRS